MDYVISNDSSNDKKIVNAEVTYDWDAGLSTITIPECRGLQVLKIPEQLPADSLDDGEFDFAFEFSLRTEEDSDAFQSIIVKKDDYMGWTDEIYPPLTFEEVEIITKYVLKEALGIDNVIVSSSGNDLLIGNYEIEADAGNSSSTFSTQFSAPVRSKTSSYQPNYGNPITSPKYTSNYIPKPTLNEGRLRNDLMNYYGTAACGPFPIAQADLIHVQRASSDELIREAQKIGFDLNKYIE